jgi:hypothetical protein
VRRIRSTGGRNRRNRYFVTLPENPDKITTKQLQGKNNTVICDTETVTFDTVNGDTSVTRIKSPKNRHGNRQKRVPFPGDFRVSAEVRDWAAAKQLPSPDAEIEKFKNYHLAKGSTFADWPAAFRNWILKAAEFSSNGRVSSTRVVAQAGKYAHLG